MLDYFEFEGYKLLMTGLDCTTHEDIWCRGIVYCINNIKYDICINSIGMARILINYPNQGSYKDLPFNSKTIELLPSQIIVEKI